jgi:small subunit ribosomal protein S16
MAVVIRMMRAGAKKRPFYRVVVADSRRQRDGRFVEILGFYDPMAKPYEFKVDEDKVKAWIAEGAQPSTQAASLLRKIGIVAPKASKVPKAAATKTKKGVERAKPRKRTERKLKNKAARVKKKANPKKRQPKKK